MALCPNLFHSRGIRESFEILTSLARTGDQNSFTRPFIQSAFVGRLVNARHCPRGVAIHRGRQTREPAILMPGQESTECPKSTVEGHPPGAPTLHSGSTSFFRPLQSLASSLSALHPNHHALVIVGPGSKGTFIICNHLSKPDGAFNKSCEHLNSFFLSDLEQGFPERTGKNNTFLYPKVTRKLGCDTF